VSRAKRHPYTRRLKRQITLRLEAPTIAYFRRLSADLGVPYQTLINLYLRDCASKRKRPSLDWKPAV